MKKLRPFIAMSVILLTVAIFIYYFSRHPEVGHQLKHTSIGLLAKLLALYLFSIAALAGSTIATLKLCKLTVDKPEAFLLTAYSAVINFFGPLQSGPAFRAAYLKKKYDLNLKKYAAASLVYLFFWGIYSGLMLLYGLLHWWLLGLGVLAIIAALILKRLPRVQQRLQGLELKWWYYLALATAVQIAFVVVIYYSELKSVAPATHFSQAVVYTGAANLALYVSLTPGAIGFRETFLVFSRHLHHISNSSIVAASILDRAAYIVVLLLLAVLIFGTHASRRLQSVKSASD